MKFSVLLAIFGICGLIFSNVSLAEPAYIFKLKKKIITSKEAALLTARSTEMRYLKIIVLDADTKEPITGATVSFVSDEKTRKIKSDIDGIAQMLFDIDTVVAAGIKLKGYIETSTPAFKLKENKTKKVFLEADGSPKPTRPPKATEPGDPTAPPVEPTKPPGDPTTPPVEPTEPPVNTKRPTVKPTNPPLPTGYPTVHPTSVPPTTVPVQPTAPPNTGAAPDSITTSINACNYKLTINWKDNTSNETSFKVYVDGDLFGSPGANTKTLTIDVGLPPNSSGRLRIRIDAVTPGGILQGEEITIAYRTDTSACVPTLAPTAIPPYVPPTNVPTRTPTPKPTYCNPLAQNCWADLCNPQVMSDAEMQACLARKTPIGPIGQPY
jgi:hypothetical protein